jgi:predicted phosphodiesterase
MASSATPFSFRGRVGDGAKQPRVSLTPSPSPKDEGGRKSKFIVFYSPTTSFFCYAIAAMRKRSLLPRLSGKLDRLYENAPVLRMGADDKLVIISDLHMGNGGKKDEFVPNAKLFLALLRRYYQKQGFILALNGDIEDLVSFSLASIATRWLEVYQALEEFAARDALYKLVGNHDLALLDRRPADLPFPVSESLRVEIGEKRLWLFHGHQVSRTNWAFETMGTLLLRGLLHPLGIGNYTVRRSTSRRFHVEQRAYLYARAGGMLAVIGHTHRPLFESLSRLDTVKIEIENLCRRFPAALEKERAELKKRVERLKKEFVAQRRRDLRSPRGENLYHKGPLLPCLFNSGSGIGRHGVTAIEIAAGRITLAIWFDRRRSEKYTEAAGYEPQQLGHSDYFRVVLKEEDLDYIFARINLLG